MNYHIHPSPENTPKNLPRFSLYTTEKPDLLKKHLSKPRTHEGGHGGAVDFINLIAQPTALEKWRESRHAYLQELEFKVRQGVYEIQTGKEWYIIQIDFEEGNYHIYCHDNIKYPGRRKYKTFKESNISHYRPGQTVPSSAISYAREVEKQEKEFNVGDTVYDNFPSSDFFGKEYIIENNEHHYWIKDAKGKLIMVNREGFNLYHSHYKPGQNTEWQPSPEPEERIYTGEPEGGARIGNDGWETNPLHDKWLTDRSEGKVQAIVNLNI